MDSWLKVDGQVIRHVAHDCELLDKGQPAPWARSAVETAVDATTSDEEALAFLVRVSKMRREAPDLPRWELEYSVAQAYIADRERVAAGEGVPSSAKLWKRVTLERTMEEWRKFDRFVASVDHLGSPDRQRVRRLLEEMGHDEDLVMERLALVHQVQSANLPDLSVEQIEGWLAKCVPAPSFAPRRRELRHTPHVSLAGSTGMPHDSAPIWWA